MNSSNRKVIEAHAQKLSIYGSLAEAQTSLTSQKNSAVASLLDDAAAYSDTQLDFSVESLLRLERFYFEQASVLNTSALDNLAAGCAFYFGEVVVRNVPDADWIVKEFAFQGGRYEIGVRFKNLTMMIGSFSSKLNHKLNSKRNSMWRTYHAYFVPNSKIGIRF